MKLILFAAMVPFIGPAQAHSWYPMECCGGQDCHETDMVTEMPDGSARVQAGKDTMIVPRGFKRRPSQDAHYHVCYGELHGSIVIYCFFQPTQS